jgi:hypothetical protein
MKMFDEAQRIVALRKLAKSRPRPLILALDIATRTGWALGELGTMPNSSSIRFGNQSTDADVIFKSALCWTEGFVKRVRPDLVIYEAMLPPLAKLGVTSAAVRDRLAGLQGIMRAVCRRYEVGLIVDCNVGDVRQHFIGDRRLKRDPAKREVLRRCAQLGWAACDDNAGDALAIFSYACAIIDPVSALKTTPLFNRAVAL